MVHAIISRHKETVNIYPTTYARFGVAATWDQHDFCFFYESCGRKGTVNFKNRGNWM